MHYLLLWIKFFLVPGLLPQLTARRERMHKQRLSRQYRRKKSFVKSIWVISATTMLFNPVLYIILPVALFTTFISFSILDETA